MSDSDRIRTITILLSKQSNKNTKPKPVTKEQVQNMIRSITPVVEQKYTDSVWSSYQPTYSFGGLAAITIPGQGTSRSTRVGDIFRWKKIELRGQYYGAVSHIVRMIVFAWHPASTPTGGLVLDGTYASSFRAPFAPYNLTAKDQYSILFDTTFKISATGSQQQVFHLKKKMDTVAKYDTGSTTVGTNALYVLMVQDGITTLGTIDMVLRMHFVDE